jgi:hypothetical protein
MGVSSKSCLTLNYEDVRFDEVRDLRSFWHGIVADRRSDEVAVF